MRQFLTAFFLVALLPLFGFAQKQETIEVPVAAELLPQDASVHFALFPITGERFGFFMSEEKVSVLRFNKEMVFQERFEFKTDKKVRTGDFLGVYRDGDKLNVLGRLKDEVGYFVYAFTPSKKPSLELIGPFEKNAIPGQLIGAMTFPDRVVALTVNEGTSVVNLNIFDEGGQFKSAGVDLSTWVRGLSVTEMLKENQVATTGYYPYLGAANIIEKEITNDFRVTKRRLKIYRIEDKLVFSLDYAKGTNLAIVGLNDLSVRINEFKAIPISQSGNVEQTSLVYGNSIYMLALNDKELAVRVADIYSGKPRNFYLCSLESGCDIARTPFLKYTSKPYKKEEVQFADFLGLVNSGQNFDPALSALRESEEGIELAIGMNSFSNEPRVDVTALFKTRLSLDGSVLLAGAPNETAADEAVGYAKLILRPWGLATQRLGDKILIGTYNPDAQNYVIAMWPIVTGSAN